MRFVAIKKESARAREESFLGSHPEVGGIYKGIHFLRGTQINLFFYIFGWKNAFWRVKGNTCVNQPEEAKECWMRGSEKWSFPISATISINTK